MGAYPTIRLGSDTPAAPANGINVEFQGVPSVNNPTQVNVSAAIVGPGGTTEFLRADGTWAPAGGGSAGFANLAKLPTLPTPGSFAGYTCWLKIPASSLLLAAASQIEVGVMVASGTVIIAGAVIRRAAAFGTAFIDSTPVTWGSNASPSLSTVGVNLSDPISVTVDLEHDYWIMIYFDPSSTGDSTQYTGWQNEDAGYTPAYQFGDQRATAMPSLSPAANYLKGIQQVLAE
jgi:hypothetical protein